MEETVQWLMDNQQKILGITENLYNMLENKIEELGEPNKKYRVIVSAGNNKKYAFDVDTDVKSPLEQRIKFFSHIAKKTIKEADGKVIDLDIVKL